MNTQYMIKWQEQQKLSTVVSKTQIIKNDIDLHYENTIQQVSICYENTVRFSKSCSLFYQYTVYHYFIIHIVNWHLVFIVHTEYRFLTLLKQ